MIWNGMVGCMPETGIMGELGVEGVNDKGKELLDMCRYRCGWEFGAKYLP